MTDSLFTDDLIDDDEAGAGAGSKKTKVKAVDILRYLIARWSSQPASLAGFSVLFGISVLCDLALPLAAAKLVESLSGTLSPERISDTTKIYGVFVALAFTFYMLRNLSSRFWNPFAARNMKGIVTDAFSDVQRFSADWHANNFAGATVRRVSRAMWAYDSISDTVAWFVLPAAFVLVGVTIMTLVQWPLIGIFVGVVIAIYVISVIWMAQYYIAPLTTVSNAADTAVGAALADAVTSNPAVKAFGAETREEARFSGIVEDWRTKALRTWMRFTQAWVVQNLLLFVLQAGLLGLVIREWAKGSATPGDAVFAITSFFLVSGYLRSLGENVQTLQRGFADIEDVVAYSQQKPDVADPDDAPDFAPGKGEIEFQHVAFRYAGQDENLYRDFSLTIHAGETVALVGPTGSGKSTFVKLIQRLYDVDGGAVLIDGQNVRSVRQASLRQAIALVPQDPALFHRTLRENIAYATPDASLETIERAATQARAHDFISKLPLKYDTLVGERGVKLSGGERQRVALARAFLADAPVLILDEATSSLDTETERDVQAAMAELMAGRTTIVIAHRLSTVRNADRILVFNEGKIVEQGRHNDLVALGGSYARLHALSVGEMLGEAA